MNDPLAIQPDEQSRFKTLLENSKRFLFQEQNQEGYWEGELSSSALSTATALCALEAYIQTNPGIDTSRRLRLADLIQRGRMWLIQNQNSDGGWGDTVKSHSNISTTLLAWGALHCKDSSLPNLEHAEEKAQAWIENAAGSLNPADIARAVRARYGKDQTFSVPILMALASTGRLGEPHSQSWTLVPQLPFELAAFPRSWFAAMKLPVVSYALPALIAIGLVRHRKVPTWNPIARLVRAVLTPRCLRVLQSIQPQSGGFLEAIPLTSFVAIALVGAGCMNHPVLAKGVDFLESTFRQDGSWAIDTHLATWVSTLSVNALSHGASLNSQLQDEGKSLKSWICRQQYTEVHPFTNAAPGGWSWTPLSGGVPDADDTPGAMLALRAFFELSRSDSKQSDPLQKQAIAGAVWLIDLQNRDGGIPTFCRGWGTLPFDRSNPDITAHAIRAWLAWYDDVDNQLQKRIELAILKGMRFLKQRQRSDGAWVPLWFGNQYVQDEENLTYGTSRVLLAWLSCYRRPWLSQNAELQIQSGISKASLWLVEAQQADGSWTGGDRNSLQNAYRDVDPYTIGSVEETALAIEALADLLKVNRESESPIFADRTVEFQIRQAIMRGVAWLGKKTKNGTEFPPSPIGFYFAKLWYYEKHYPICYSVAALERVSKAMRYSQ